LATIERYVEPRRLYRYRGTADLDREINAITESYLYCAAYEDLNDPMEGRFISSGRLRRSAKYRAIRKAIIDTKSQIGICSFSEVHDHELMWAHYAEKFKGICVAYNFSRLLRNLPADVEFTRMYYNETEPTVHFSRTPTDELAKMVLCYKNYRWLYEREWRMFATRGRIEYSDPSCVTHVYLGARMSQGDRYRVRNRLLQFDIKTSEMKIDAYSISFER
jgi:hypothetical protein